MRQYMVVLTGAFFCLTGPVFAAEDCDRLAGVGQLQARLECLQRNTVELEQQLKSLQIELDALKRGATEAVKVGENIKIMVGNLCVTRSYGPEFVGPGAAAPKYVGTADCALRPEWRTFHVER